jgi:hypothetical protein
MRMLRWVGVFAALICAGCAFNIVSLKQEPAQFQAAATDGIWRLGRDTQIILVSGWAVKLKKDTTWRSVGRIQQGDVFATRDQIVTVEASNMYEAEPVVRDGRIVGFYLIVEKTFTPADPPSPVDLVLRQ